MGLVENAASFMLQGAERMESLPEGNLIVNAERTIRGFGLELSLEHILANGDDDLLGVYRPMTSPGKVTLMKRALRELFWHIVKQVTFSGLPIQREDLLPIALLVAQGTYHHEYFHFFCDFQRHLFPESAYKRDTEEALATAYARLKADEQRQVWQSKVGRLPGFVFYRVVRHRFSYSAQGYRDWQNFQNWEALLDGLLSYINPPNTDFLLSSGVDLDGMLRVQLERVYGCRLPEELV